MLKKYIEIKTINTPIQKLSMALDPDMSRNPGYCESISSLCKNKGRELCEICKGKHNELLDIDFKMLSLNNFLSFSVSDAWKYFEKQKLWKKDGMNIYIPDSTNKFAKERKLNKLSMEQLSIGEIYFVFNAFLKKKQEEYKNQHNIVFPKIIEKNYLLNHTFSPVKDYFDYNILERDWSFSIQNERPKNTSLVENTYQVPDLSLLKLEISQNSTNNQIKKAFKAINRIPEFTIKEDRFEKLSDQIKYYLENFGDLTKSQVKNIVIDTKENRKLIDEFLSYVEYIEQIVSCNSHQGNSYINNIFGDLKDEFEKDLLNIEGKDFLEKMKFDIAPTKRDFRAVQKIIISHNGDISRATDNCRGTITFDSIDELQKGTVQFIKNLEKYNKKQIKEKKEDHTKISEVYFEDKFGNFFDFSRKSSGYRDGKFLIKLGDGNVFELMVQLKDMGIAKNEGFEYIADKGMDTLISKMVFTKEEINRINNIIDTLDKNGTKWGIVFPEGLKYFDEIKEGDRIPADFIYNIYRNLDEHDRDAWKKKDTFPFDKDIKDWTLLQKLQFIEREIYQWGFKLHSDRLFFLGQQERFAKNDNKLKKRILT